VFRVEPGVYFVGDCGFGFIDPSLVNPTLIDRPAVSFEDLIRYMIDEVIVLDESCFYDTYCKRFGRINVCQYDRPVSYGL
jgi:hypothetical protein